MCRASFVVATLLALQPGCMALMATFDRPGVYAGTRWFADEWPWGRVFPAVIIMFPVNIVALFDLPLTAIVDTALLPLMLPFELREQLRPEPEVPALPPLRLANRPRPPELATADEVALLLDVPVDDRRAAYAHHIVDELHGAARPGATVLLRDPGTRLDLAVLVTTWSGDEAERTARVDRVRALRERGAVVRVLLIEADHDELSAAREDLGWWVPDVWLVTP
jgi:uncharacterized protein YceK